MDLVPSFWLSFDSQLSYTKTGFLSNRIPEAAWQCFEMSCLGQIWAPIAISFGISLTCSFFFTPLPVPLLCFLLPFFSFFLVPRNRLYTKFGGPLRRERYSFSQSAFSLCGAASTFFSRSLNLAFPIEAVVNLGNSPVDWSTFFDNGDV